MRIGGPTVTVRNIKSGKNPFASLAGEIFGGALVGLAMGATRCTAKTLACSLFFMMKDSDCSAVNRISLCWKPIKVIIRSLKLIH